MEELVSTNKRQVTGNNENQIIKTVLLAYTGRAYGHMLKMITHIIYFVIFFTTSQGSQVEIKTADSGRKNSHKERDISHLYKQLTPYGIYPTEERSLTFEVKACNDADLLLSSSRDFNHTDFYELIFGGGVNTKIFLRRKYGQNVHLATPIAARKCINCLSCNQYSRFTVQWSEEGTITATKDSITYLTWTDNAAIPVVGLGIMTGWGSNGSWLFELTDCSNGTYGFQCQYICGHCKLNNTCDRINGSCFHGCANGWEGDKCDSEKLCRCSCEYKKKLEYWSKIDVQKYSREELEQMLAPKLEKIRQELALNKSALSSNQRRRTSASDNRKSSKQIGIVGTVFIAMVIGLVVLIDITAARRELQHVRRIWPQNP